MSIPTIFFRILRKRWVLGLILTLSVIYFFGSMSFMSLKGNWPDVGKLMSQSFSLGTKQNATVRNFNWHSFFNTNNGTMLKTCRNSVQGKTLIADERGNVCDRIDLQPGGCCNVKGESTRQFTCAQCDLKSGCCLVYEHCISCCLLPDKQPLLKTILRKALESYNPIYSSVTDHFELCLTKCRTSSMSVQHENSYKDPKYKHCYKDQVASEAVLQGT